MILTCPECSTRYHVDPASLGPTGRSVRCANCGHRWLAKPAADEPNVVELTPPAPPGGPRMRPVAAPEQRRGRPSTSLVGWLLGVLVALLVASAVVGRDQIVAGFPASAAIYQKLGLPVTLRLGLEFEGVTSRRVDEGGITVLIVEGAVVNVTGQPRTVPPVRLTLLDGSGRELQQEEFRIEDERLPGGAKASFSTRVVNPAEDARKLDLTFDVASRE